MKLLRMISLILVVVSGLSACTSENGGTTGGNPYSEDVSVSGASAQALGGALSASASGGLQASYQMQPASQQKTTVATSLQNLLWSKAWAAGLCPTFLTAAGPSCSASGSAMTLVYDSCSFGSSVTSWEGRKQLTMSAGAAACGTFPHPGAGGSLYRQFVNAAATSPGVMQITSAYGTLALIDHVTANLSNFDGAAIPTITNGGYGMKVDFDGSGARSAVTIAERVRVIGAYDHSIHGSLTITETSGASSRTANGTVDVYLNIAEVIGTSVFTNVVHSDMCCQPTSGSITTTFAAGSSPPTTAIGLLMVGQSETLTFTGCGTANLVAFDGSTKQVRLSRCF